MAEISKLTLEKDTVVATEGFAQYEVGTWGDVDRVAFEAGKPVTVREILEKADREADGFDILVGDEPATLDTIVKPGQRVLLNDDIDGN